MSLGSLAWSCPYSAGLGQGMAEMARDYRYGCIYGIYGGKIGWNVATEGEED